MHYGTLPSRAMATDMDYAVFVPKALMPEERLPIVVFLHGGGDSESSFDKHGLSKLIDQAMSDGTIPRAIVVVPDGSLGFWTNWYDRSRLYEDWVIKEALPHVQARYHTGTCPEACHVMGVSMGGNGALRFALTNPGKFASATALSAPILDTDAMISMLDNRLINVFVPTHRIFGPKDPRSRVESKDVFLQWTSSEDLHGTALSVAWARGDRKALVKSGEKFVDHLSEHGIAHHHEVFDGGHNWKSWNPVIVKALARVLAARPDQQP